MTVQNKPATKVVTEKVRFSYTYVFEPREAEGQEPKYSVTLLIPKTDTVTLNKIRGAIDAAKAKGKQQWNGVLPPNLPTPIHDGDGVRQSGDPYGPECKGCFVLTASSRTQPEIVDESLNRILDRDDFYSGCYGRASLNFYPYNAAGKRGIACGLNNLQKLADGERLDGRSSAEEDFGGESPALDDFMQ